MSDENQRSLVYVLIVDDEDLWRRLLVRVLKRSKNLEKWNLHIDAPISLDILQKLIEKADYSYHIWIQDIRLDDKFTSGIGPSELLQMIKNTINKPTKVIYNSAFGTPEEIRELLGFGVFDFISKDEFDRESFATVIERAIQELDIDD